MVADGGDQSSVPSVVDGLTPMQRTILLCAFKNPGYKKVEDFIRFVSVQSGYEKQNLETTMAGMAGSNNVNLLRQFGAGGRVQLSSITKYLFHESDQPLRKYLFHESDQPLRKYLFHDSDQPLQKYLNDDEKSVEPPWLMPVIPMVLVNGGENYNPRQVIATIRWLLKNRETSNTTLGEEEYEAHQHSETTIRDQMEQEVVGGYHNKLELDTRCNMHLLDKKGLKKQQFGSLEAILEEFYDLRLRYYEKRKSAMLDAVTKAMEQLENEDDDDFCRGTIIQYDKEAEVLFAELKDNHCFRSMEYSLSTIGSEINPRYVEWAEKMNQFDMLKVTSAQELWLHDLDALEEQLDEQYKENEAEGLEQYYGKNQVEGRKKWISVVVESDSESEDDFSPVVSDSESEDDFSPVEQYGKDEAEGREKWSPPMVSDSKSEEEEDSPEQSRKRRRTA